VERPARRIPDPAFEARVEALKHRRNRLAEELQLAPGVLCPNGTLEAIARAEPTSLDALANIPELRRWQVKVLGPSLLEAVAASG
jgi:ribonuclease D